MGLFSNFDILDYNFDKIKSNFEKFDLNSDNQLRGKSKNVTSFFKTIYSKNGMSETSL